MTNHKLANLKELVGLLTAAFQVQKEVADILEDYEKRLYSLEQDRIRCVNAIRALEKENQNLRTRYSEVLYKFSNK